MSKVTVAGLGALLQFVYDHATHLAIGTGTTAVTGQETALVNETARARISGRAIIGNSLYVDFFVASTDFNFQWEEVGVVLDGADALATGTLATRHLLRYNKPANASEAANVQIEIVVAN